MVYLSAMQPTLFRSLAAPVVALHLMVAAVVPIAHAQTEVLQADPTIESGHSDACSVLHVEMICAIGGVAHLPGSDGPTRVTAPVRSCSLLLSHESPFRFDSKSTANAVRGPPPSIL